MSVIALPTLGSATGRGVEKCTGIKIKGFVVLRGWIKGFCPRIPVFLSKFVRDSHPVADPSAIACYMHLHSKMV